MNIQEADIQVYSLPPSKTDYSQSAKKSGPEHTVKINNMLKTSYFGNGPSNQQCITEPHLDQPAIRVVNKPIKILQYQDVKFSIAESQKSYPKKISAERKSICTKPNPSKMRPAEENGDTPPSQPGSKMSFLESRETRNKSMMNQDIFSEFNTSAEEEIKLYHSVDHDDPEDPRQTRNMEAQQSQPHAKIQSFDQILKRESGQNKFRKVNSVVPKYDSKDIEQQLDSSMSNFTQPQVKQQKPQQAQPKIVSQKRRIKLNVDQNQAGRNDKIVQISQFLKDQNEKQSVSQTQTSKNEMNFTFSNNFPNPEKEDNSDTKTKKSVDQVIRPMIVKRNRKLHNFQSIAPVSVDQNLAVTYGNQTISPRNQKTAENLYETANHLSMSAHTSTRQTTGLSQNSYFTNGQMDRYSMPPYIDSFNDNFNVSMNSQVQQRDFYDINQYQPTHNQYSSIIQSKPRTSNMPQKTKPYLGRGINIGLQMNQMPHEQFIDNQFNSIHLPKISQPSANNTNMMNPDDQIQRRNIQINQQTRRQQSMNIIEQNLIGSNSKLGSHEHYQKNQIAFSPMESRNQAQEQFFLFDEQTLKLHQKKTFHSRTTRQSPANVSIHASAQMPDEDSMQYRSTNQSQMKSTQDQDILDRQRKIEQQAQMILSPKAPKKGRPSELKYHGEGIVLNSPHRQIKGSSQLPQAFRIIRNSNVKNQQFVNNKF